MTSSPEPTRESPGLWRSLIAFDFGNLSLHRGLYGVIVLLFALALVVLIGTSGLTVGLGAVIVLAAGSAAPLRSRVVATGATTLLGSALTLVGVWAGAEGWTAALVMTVVSFCAAMAAAYGKGAATSAYLLNVWVLVSLLLTASDHDPVTFSVAFLVGGALAVVLVAVRGVRGGETAGESADAAAPPSESSYQGLLGPLRAQLRMSSPLLRYAAVRAVSAGLTTLIGWYLFPDHPYWAVLTAFVIIQTDPQQTLVLGVHRAFGTVAAVLVMVPFLNSVDNSAALLAAFVVSGTLMLALAKVNYALFTLFTTVVVLLMARLTQDDTYQTGWDRLLATLLGVALALGVIGVARLLSRRDVRTVDS